MCCENPIDLGCINSCDNIKTQYELQGEGMYKVRFMYNGSEVTSKFIAINENGYLAIPSTIFNETTPTQFALYNSSDVFLGCYKFKPSPNTELPDQTVEQTSYQLDSWFELVSKSYANNVTTFLVKMHLSSYAAMYDGAEIFMYNNFGSIARFNQAANSSIVTSDDNMHFIVPLASALGSDNMLFEVLVNNTGGSQNIELVVSNESYSGLISPWFGGVSTPIILKTI